MAYQSPEEKHELNKQCLAPTIDQDPVGRKLAPEARERALEFAAKAWSGQVNAGAAAQLGIKHVTAGVLKDEK